jgi:uncharacterized membrane protein HdeD (DUF308 family)
MNHEISLGQAFGYCFHQPVYVLFFVIGIIVLIGGIYLAKKTYDKDVNWGMKQTIIVGLSLLIFLSCLLAKPVSVKPTPHRNRPQEECS